MIDYQTLKLLHRHGTDWVELEPHQPHDPASVDIERTWGRGARIFKCTKCDEEVAVLPPDSEDAR
jgi:hypothetical protein